MEREKKGHIYGFHMIAWSKLCRPKKERGLGLHDFRTFNLSLLGKWMWKLQAEGEGGSSLWQKDVICK